MSDGPVANYTYTPWQDKPGTKVGFDAVGPGWKPLLEAVDEIMEWAIETVRINSKCAKRSLGCTDDASIKVLQIKEKFGGLRIYWSSQGLGEKLKNQVYGATTMAETMSFKMCERCGSFQGVETRIKKVAMPGWTLTLCGSCHEERDTNEAFQMGL